MGTYLQVRNPTANATLNASRNKRQVRLSWAAVSLTHDQVASLFLFYDARMRTAAEHVIDDIVKIMVIFPLQTWIMPTLLT